MAEGIETKKSRRMPLIGALIGISLGIWLLLESQGVSVPAMVKFWPVFIGLGAVASFLDFALTKTASSLGKGILGVVLCATAFMLTFEVWDWREPFTWLPAIPLGAGLGMLASFFASSEGSHRTLIRGSVFTILGVLGWLPQFPQIQAMLPSLQTIWAVALVLIGIVILVQQLRK